jgi:hypothetical protein
MGLDRKGMGNLAWKLSSGPGSSGRGKMSSRISAIGLPTSQDLCEDDDSIPAQIYFAHDIHNLLETAVIVPDAGGA